MAGGGVSSRVDAGVRVVPTEQIVGSVGRWRELRADFFPRAHPEVSERHRRIGDAMRRGAALPPLELYAVAPRSRGDGAGSSVSYFVVDGHHRVAMARKLGQDFVDAHVVEYRVSGAASAIGRS